MTRHSARISSHGSGWLALQKIEGAGRQSASPEDADSAAAFPVTRTSIDYTTLFADGFEGSTPPWQVSIGPLPSWGFTTNRASEGQWSAFCAQQGIGAPGPYANDMNTGIRAGPFDLSGFSDAVLTYSYYLRSELNYDYLNTMVSTDGTNFYGWGDSGESYGWTSKIVHLTDVPTLGNLCGQSQVWIAFWFRSDGSDTAEGAYVDDVKLYGVTNIPTPTTTGFLPASGTAGTSVTITGTGFTGATSVMFHGMAAATFSVVSDTQIVAKVPPAATCGNIAITTPGGVCGSASDFRVVPKITTLSPTVVRRNGVVVILGSGFGSKSSSSIVRFGTAKCVMVESWGRTRIKCRVPTKARVGRLNVRVMTAGGPSNAKTFRVRR
jgi:hypothetical protein